MAPVRPPASFVRRLASVVAMPLLMTPLLTIPVVILAVPSIASAAAPAGASIATPTTNAGANLIPATTVGATLRPSLVQHTSLSGLGPSPAPNAAQAQGAEKPMASTTASASLRLPSSGLASHLSTGSAPLAAVPPPQPMGRLHTFIRIVGKAALQVGGIAVGLGEKALGGLDPNLTGAYKPVEVKPPPNDPRSLIVFRSNQPKTADDIGTIVDMARQRGITNPSQIEFINLRSEKEEDPKLVAQYEAQAGGGQAGQIKTLDVKIIDNAPPAFYIGSLGWNRAVAQVKQVYVALKDPSIKLAVIHCEQGGGRTGEIVATAVRVAMDGMSPEAAVAEAEQHGLKMPWQRAFIERFAREWQAGKINFD